VFGRPLAAIIFCISDVPALMTAFAQTMLKICL
jgi:hypothetical protein